MTGTTHEVEMSRAVERWREAGIITADQAEAIVALEATSPTPAIRPDFALSPSQIVTYIGGVLAIVASIVFIGVDWERMGARQQVLWGVLAVAVPWLIGRALRRSSQPLARQASPVLFALGSFAILLLAYAIYQVLAIWPDNLSAPGAPEKTRTLMGAAQAVAAVAMLSWAIRLRTPWLLLPSALLGWMAWMSGVDNVLDAREDGSGRAIVEALFGMVLIGASLVLLRQAHRRAGFYLAFAGLTLTWLTLAPRMFMDALGPAGLLLLVLSVIAIVLSVASDLRVFLLYGAVGLYAWLSALVIDTFGGSRPVAFALILVGVAIVVAGLLWQRMHDHHLPHGPATVG